MRKKAEVKRLTASVLIAEMLHFFTHFEKGFLRTSLDYIIRPGITSLNFLHGKRKKYQPPVTYFFIWTGLYILIHNFLITHYQYHLSAENLAQMNLRDQANN